MTLYATAEERKAADLQQRREAQARYRVSAKGKATATRYWQSPKGRAASSANRDRNWPEWREHSREWQRQHAAERPDEYRARHAVNYAIRTGRLVKPTSCEACGETGRLHGHHHRGYTGGAELDVLWLCPACHRARHPKGGDAQ